MLFLSTVKSIRKLDNEKGYLKSGNVENKDSRDTI